MKHNHQKWLVEIDEQQQMLDAAAANEDETKQAEHAENSDTASSATTATVEIEQQQKQRETAVDTQLHRQPNGTNKVCVEEDNLGRFEVSASR